MDGLYKSKENCCGCTACFNICLSKAIIMQPDEDGFLYPLINNQLCVKCGLCQKVCAFQSKIISQNRPLNTYAAVLNDKLTLKNSSSGGAFVAIATYVLKKNGVVFGCAWNSQIQPEHICIENISDIKKLQGSKYVQSNLNSTFSEIKNYIRSGRQVLFTGTPCQIVGLLSYLGKNYDNLLTVDIICHGVPSPAFFKGYINFLEDKLNSKVIDFQFRDKSKGWGLIGKVTYQKKGKIREKLIPPIVSYYYHYFLTGDIYRKSCYICPYASSNRTGDFTIGDYWGIEKAHPEVDNKDGVSLILVNSKKGMGIIDKIDLKLIKSNLNKARNQNGQLNHSTHKSDRRDEILKLFRDGSFKTVADKYYKEMKNQIIVYKLKMIIPQPLKFLINVIIGKIGKG